MPGTSGYARRIGVHVVRPAFGLEPLRAEKRRIADDRVGLWPGRRIARGVDQGIADREIGVQIVQRQRLFGDVQFVDRQFSGDHQRDLGQIDGEGIDVHAEEVRGGDEPEYPLRRIGLRRHFANPFVNSGFKPLEFTIGDIQEIARSAGGVQHGEVVHPFAQFGQLADGFRVLDLFAPRFDDRRTDDLHNIDRLVKWAPKACRSALSVECSKSVPKISGRTFDQSDLAACRSCAISSG